MAMTSERYRQTDGRTDNISVAIQCAVEHRVVKTTAQNSITSQVHVTVTASVETAVS